MSDSPTEQVDARPPHRRGGGAGGSRRDAPAGADAGTGDRGRRPGLERGDGASLPSPGAAPTMGDYRMALVVAVDGGPAQPASDRRASGRRSRPAASSPSPSACQDAVALSHAMRRIPTPRPLTHELMSQVLQGFDIDVVAVRIVGRQGAVYFAELDLRGRNGRHGPTRAGRPTA